MPSQTVILFGIDHAPASIVATTTRLIEAFGLMTAQTMIVLWIPDTAARP